MRKKSWRTTSVDQFHGGDARTLGGKDQNETA
jgi:hypothetical protein